MNTPILKRALAVPPDPAGRGHVPGHGSLTTQRPPPNIAPPYAIADLLPGAAIGARSDREGMFLADIRRRFANGGAATVLTTKQYLWLLDLARRGGYRVAKK